MKTIYYSLGDKCSLPPSVATVGFFDGVHLGHRYVLGQVVDEARRQGVSATVVTFARSPRQVVQPDWTPRLLTTLDEKLEQLHATGVDQVVVLRFDAAMAALSGRAFMERVLRDDLGVRTLLMGYDNRFGHDRSDRFEDFCRYGDQLGVSVRQLTQAPAGAVSSTRVREALMRGDVAEASRLLGRYYNLFGQVVSGEHIGTVLGFPTANLAPDTAEKLLPAPGVYAVKVWLEQSSALLQGMMNIGTRPTFDGRQQTLETHIFDYHDNLYGQRISIRFVDRLRDEVRFDSREALVSQLQRDASQARSILNTTI